METQPPKRGEYVLFSAQPKSGRGVRVAESAIAWYCPHKGDQKFGKIVRATVSSSLLTHGFNRLWCAALTYMKVEGCTHFFMIHDDIGCGTGMAEILLGEMEKTGADLVSAVVPIKDKRGLTSTAIDGNDIWSPRRLTMREVYNRDETWTEEGLVVNSALWLCDLRGDWCKKVLFRQTDQMMVTEDAFLARTMSEDWDFSRQVKHHGGKIFATRKTPLYHEQPEFHNCGPWGEWETDRGDSSATPASKSDSDPSKEMKERIEEANAK